MSLHAAPRHTSFKLGNMGLAVADHVNHKPPFITTAQCPNSTHAWLAGVVVVVVLAQPPTKQPSNQATKQPSNQATKQAPSPSPARRGGHSSHRLVLAYQRPLTHGQWGLAGFVSRIIHISGDWSPTNVNSKINLNCPNGTHNSPIYLNAWLHLTLFSFAVYGAGGY